MMNSSSAGFHEVRRAFRRFITIGHRPVDMPAVARVDPAVLDSYQGYYQLDTPSREQERFLVPLFGMVRIDQTEAALLLTRIRIMRGATAEQLVPVSERVFRSPESPLATVVFLEGDDEGTASLAGSDYVRVPDGLVWSRWILAGGILALMASSLLGALIWLPRMLFSQTFRARGGAGVRIVPALSTMSFLAACAFLQGGLADEVERLGEASVWSGGFLVTSLLFAVTAMAGFGLALRARGLGMVPRVHVLLVTSAQVATALYLAWWEMIGLQTWT
jgi:hypothetical protein